MTVTPNQQTENQPAQQQQAEPQPQQAEQRDQQAQQGGGYDYAAAIAKHKRNVKKLDELITAGVKDAKDKKKDSDYGVKWPNSAQWIGEAKKTALHALTKTHDSDARVQGAGQAAPANVARFGVEAAVPADSTYDKDDAASLRNIDIDGANTGGWRMAGKIAIVEPVDQGDKQLKGTIVHEVQHDADKHTGASAERYKSEFRAYWVDQTFKAESAAAGSAASEEVAGFTVAFTNKRQRAIFKHLYAEYPYVSASWENEDFRKVVEAMKKPDSVNWVNSPRIDDLYAELQKEKPSAGDVDKKVTALTAEDKTAIKGSKMKGTWLALIQGRVSDGTLKKAHLAKLASGLEWPELKTLKK